MSGAGLEPEKDRPVRKEELFSILGWRPSKVTLAAWKRDGLIEAYALPGSKSGCAWAYSYNSIMRFLDEAKKAGRRSAGQRKEAVNA